MKKKGKMVQIEPCLRLCQMYYIKLNDEVISKTDDIIVAMINYRYLLHKANLKDNENTATMMQDSSIIHQHKINTQTAQMSFGQEMDANKIFLSIVNHKKLSVNDLKKIIKNTGLQVSNSKISGWLSSPERRTYQVMHNDELFIMLKGIIAYEDVTKAGYSPENLKKLIEQTGLSNAEFSRKFEIPLNTLSANVCEIDKSKHRSMSHKTWLELAEKVKLFLENA